MPIKRNKRRNKRATMTSKDRRSSLFRRRIVVPLPEWSVFVMAGAIVFGLMAKPLLVTNIVALILCVIALACVWTARRQVRGLRHDVHEALNNIDYAYDEVKEDSSTPRVEKFQLKRVNGKSSSRVSE